MKVSFSRKGFDSANGGQPNVILPDGALLPFPIPEKNSAVRYGDLQFKENALFDIISELKPRTGICRTQCCHLDPDLICDMKARPDGWQPAFGQADSSLSELKNRGFGVGDLFLFFGWFRQTEFVNGRLRYMRGAPDIHIIYGYMQVGEILTAGSLMPRWLAEHPHYGRILAGSKKDAIFLPTEKLSFMEDVPGAGMLKYSSELVLTAPGMTRSKWHLPVFFKNISIGHSPKQPPSGLYFQSATIGQEMVWDCTEDSMGWLRTILRNR